MQELNMSRSTNTDCEPIFFKLVNADTKILKQILNSQGIYQTD